MREELFYGIRRIAIAEQTRTTTCQMYSDGDVHFPDFHVGPGQPRTKCNMRIGKRKFWRVKTPWEFRERSCKLVFDFGTTITGKRIFFSSGLGSRDALH